MYRYEYVVLFKQMTIKCLYDYELKVSKSYRSTPMFRANWVGRRLITTSYFGVNRRVHWERAPCKASTRQETICPMGSPWVFGCLAPLASLKLVSWRRMVHVVFCLQEDATLLVLVCQQYGMHTWFVKKDDLHNQRSAHFNQKKPMLPSRGKNSLPSSVGPIH